MHDRAHPTRSSQRRDDHDDADPTPRRHRARHRYEGVELRTERLLTDADEVRATAGSCDPVRSGASTASSSS